MNFIRPLTSCPFIILYFTFSMISIAQINTENKVIPESIREEALTALSHFPELKDTEIIFQYKDRIRKSTMQAQPTWASFLKPRDQRAYIILISKRIQIDNEELWIDDVPSDVMIGWLGHELGHVMDYRGRSGIGMLLFGAKYLFSKGHMKEVERAADIYAIQHGMGDYILKTKNFILDHADISERYKEKLRRIYMSPEEVMHHINDESD
jgi:hypothetical protein